MIGCRMLFGGSQLLYFRERKNKKKNEIREKRCLPIPILQIALITFVKIRILPNLVVVYNEPGQTFMRKRKGYKYFNVILSWFIMYLIIIPYYSFANNIIIINYVYLIIQKHGLVWLCQASHSL